MLLESSNCVDADVTGAGVGYETAPPQTGEPEYRQVDRRLREYARKRSALDAAEASTWFAPRCTGHHAALHRGLLTITGQAPWSIQVRWMHGEPIPPGLDPDAREKVIGQRYFEAVKAMEDEAAQQAEEAPSDRVRIWCRDKAQLGRRAKRKVTWSKPAVKPPSKAA
jgi:hypothetical protein